MFEPQATPAESSSRVHAAKCRTPKELASRCKLQAAHHLASRISGRRVGRAFSWVQLGRVAFSWVQLGRVALVGAGETRSSKLEILGTDSEMRVGNSKFQVRNSKFEINSARPRVCVCECECECESECVCITSQVERDQLHRLVAGLAVAMARGCERCICMASHPSCGCNLHRPRDERSKPAKFPKPRGSRGREALGSHRIGSHRAELRAQADDCSMLGRAA